MTKQVEVSAEVLSALKACEGAMSSYVDGNRAPSAAVYAALCKHARKVIAKAERKASRASLG